MAYSTLKKTAFLAVTAACGCCAQVAHAHHSKQPQRRTYFQTPTYGRVRSWFGDTQRVCCFGNDLLSVRRGGVFPVCFRSNDKLSKCARRWSPARGQFGRRAVPGRLATETSRCFPCSGHKERIKRRHPQKYLQRASCLHSSARTREGGIHSSRRECFSNPKIPFWLQDVEVSFRTEKYSVNGWGSCFCTRCSLFHVQQFMVGRVNFQLMVNLIAQSQSFKSETVGTR